MCYEIGQLRVLLTVERRGMNARRFHPVASHLTNGAFLIAAWSACRLQSVKPIQNAKTLIQRVIIGFGSFSPHGPVPP